MKSTGMDEFPQKRTSRRSHAYGDLFFKLLSEPDESTLYGTLFNKSTSGAGILVSKPLYKGSDIELSCEAHWEGYRKATVRWCDNIAVGLYRAGVFFAQA
jgi:hypothetical protein